MSLDPTTTDVLLTLRYMSHAIDLPNLAVGDKKVISETLYNAEYHLLSIIQSIELSNKTSNHKSKPNGLNYAAVIASLLYLQLAIRQLPSPSKVHNRLVSEMEIPISRYLSTNPGLQSETPYARDIWLWIMFIKAAASNFHINDRRDTLRVGKGELGDEVKEVLRERLKKVAWREKVCGSLLDAVWRGMRGWS
jgi:hypothetical protein